MDSVGAGTQGDASAPDAPDVRWLADGENPWPVPVIDLRPFALSMVSTSTDEHAAKNVMSFRSEDGRGFVAQPSSQEPMLDLRLSYHCDGLLADGALFSPARMEHKWAIYHHREHVVVVRSWTREVVLTARTVVGDGRLDLVDGSGDLGHGGAPELTRATLDFVIRSHALGEVLPAPLPPELADDLPRAAAWCFSMHGVGAQFATPHRLPREIPAAVLRTNSLLHIAVARGDREGVEAALAAGAPTGLLAQDGLTPMHWALVNPDDAMLQLLVDRGASVDARSAQGATPLMNAVQRNDAGRIAWLIAHGADPSAMDDRGFTSLHRAAELGHADAVRVLLDAGARRAPVAQGHTPQSLAAAAGHPAIARLLAD